MSAPVTGPRLLSVGEVARRRGVHPKNVAANCHAWGLTVQRTPAGPGSPGHRRFREDEVDAFVASLIEKPPAADGAT